jgi:hypothetical protein
VGTAVTQTETQVPYVYEPFGPDGIVRMRWLPGAVITEALARTTLTELATLTAGKKAPLLADIRQMKSMTREARKVYGDATDAFSAMALLATSPVTQMIANFFIGINRTKAPTQMFTDEEKALTWLRRHKM